MCENKFYICKHCGNIVGLIKNSGVPLVCCGDSMVQLIPNSTTADPLKHVPEVVSEDGKIIVKIGQVPHPMTEEHLIEWVYVATENGGHRKCLSAGMEPRVEFCLGDDKPLAVYAYCNIHGLWIKEL